MRRYTLHDSNWYKDKPKVNRTIHNKIDQEFKLLICNIRNKLTQTKYALIGVWSIQWEFNNLRLNPCPY